MSAARVVRACALAVFLASSCSSPQAAPAKAPAELQQAFSAAPRPALPRHLELVESPLGRLRPDIVEGNLVVSPDSNHLAYVARRDGKQYVVRDDREEQAYDQIPLAGTVPYEWWKDPVVDVSAVSQGKTWQRTGCLVFSPDSRRLAYQAKQGDKWLAVIDGVAGKLHDKFTFQGIVFSADSGHVAYTVTDGGFWEHNDRVVQDGVEGPELLQTSDLAFSSDGNHIAYATRQRVSDHLTMSLDGVSLPPGPAGREHGYHEVDGPVFSPDGRRLAYRAQIYKAGTFGDGQHYVSPDQWLVVLDNSEGAKYEEIIEDSLLFSPDGQHLAYVVRERGQGGQVFVVLDGVEQKRYPQMGAGSLAFSPDSTHLVYTAGSRAGLAVVTDRAEGPRYLSAGSVTFSPDSKRMAYLAQRADGWVAVIDGVEGPVYEGIGQPGVSFSPDSRLVGYVAQRRGKLVAVIDGKETWEYDGFGEGGVVFSPGSDFVVFRAPRDGKWSVFVDGLHAGEYDYFPRGASLVFDSSTVMHTLAVRGTDVLRIEVRVHAPVAQ